MSVLINRVLEVVLIGSIRLGTLLSRQVHWAELSQCVRNAKWRALLQSLGRETVIYSHVVIHTPEKVSIGARCAIAEFVHMWGGGGIAVGDDVIIASHVVITSLTHDTRAAVYRDSLTQKKIIIEDNVWIGAGAVILPGVRIGTGSIIGAGSVVTRNVPAQTVVAGVPARALKQQ